MSDVSGRVSIPPGPGMQTPQLSMPVGVDPVGASPHVNFYQYVFICLLQSAFSSLIPIGQTEVDTHSSSADH